MERIVVALLVIAAVLAASGAARDGGGLDPTFGDDGIVVTDLGANEGAEGVVLQPNGKLVVVGFHQEREPPTTSLLVVRYERDGRPDPTFGGDGISEVAPQREAIGRAVALQHDGRIVVAGGGDRDALAARLLPDGSLDPTFHGGFVRSDWGDSDHALALALQSDGKVILAGKSGISQREGEDFAIARLNADGTHDASFSGGVVRLDLGSKAERLEAVAVDRAGRIVAVGWRETAANFEFVVVRLRPDGSLDTTFGTGGVVAGSFGAERSNAQGTSVALTPDGRVVVAGCAFGLGVARLLTDGAFDPTFGSGGKTVVAGAPCAQAVELTRDGRIVVAGSRPSVSRGATTDFAVLRLHANGRLDRTFSPAVTDMRRHDLANDLVLGTDGKPTVVGATNIGDAGEFVADIGVVRYETSSCVVPRVTRRTLAEAKTSLARAACSLGRVSFTRSAKVANGVVVSQRPRPGALLADRAPVSLVLSRGPR